MPRNRALRNTLAHPTEVKAALPYFQTWLQSVKAAPNKFLSTDYLFEHYKTLVVARTIDDQNMSDLATKDRFSHHFNVAAIEKQFVKRSKKLWAEKESKVMSLRGYEVCVQISIRAKNDNLPMTDKIKNFCESSPSLVTSTLIDKQKGFGVLAK